MLITSNNEVLVLIAEYIEDENNRDIGFDYKLMSLDMDGNLKWNYDIKGEVQSLLTILEEVDDGYILCGNMIFANKEDETRVVEIPSIIKLDKNGNKMWSKYFGESEDYVNLFELEKAYIEDDKIMIVGSNRAGGTNNIKFSIDAKGKIYKFNN